MDRLQINMETDYKGVSSLRAALKLRRDSQCGGAAHRLQQAQALLLSQQGVHTELTQADGPREGITWWCKHVGVGNGCQMKTASQIIEIKCKKKYPVMVLKEAVSYTQKLLLPLV